MELTARIYLAGHTGLVGHALLSRLRADGYRQVLTRPRAALDLRRQDEVEQFFAAQRPEYVFLAAGRVGGIHANSTYPADFIADNLAIQTNVIAASHRYGVRRLIFFGSSCAYPRDTRQPMAEDQLLTGPLEPTSRAYAVAKLAGMEMCASYNAQYRTRFLVLIPATLYGPFDNFDPSDSHVLAALLRRFHEALRFAHETGTSRPVVVWGTGSARREFLYADDLAELCIWLMCLRDGEFDELLRGPFSAVNVGGSEEVTIRELAELVREVVGYQGGIAFDPTRPDGAPRKLLESSRVRRLGWRPKTSLAEGVRKTYEWFRSLA